MLGEKNPGWIWVAYGPVSCIFIQAFSLCEEMLLRLGLLLFWMDSLC